MKVQTKLNKQTHSTKSSLKDKRTITFEGDSPSDMQKITARNDSHLLE